MNDIDIKFDLSQEQISMFSAWLPAVWKRAVEIQRENKLSVDGDYGWMYESSWDEGVPYYSAIGGGLVWSFEPTSVGINVSVWERITGEVLNLTDYESW